MFRLEIEATEIMYGNCKTMANDLSTFGIIYFCYQTYDLGIVFVLSI